MGKRKKKGGGDGGGVYSFLPITAAVAVIGFDYYATVFVFLDHWIAGGVRSDLGLLHAACFTCVAFACLFSFFIAAISDPGGVPSSYSPETENPQKGVMSKYCEKCCNYKPPRTHHCKVCKRCVLKMDHHCVWISNCVGYSNYKPFIIFVLYAAIGSIYSMVIFVCDILQTDHDFSIIYTKFFYVFSGCLVFLLCLCMSTLLGWHIYLLAHNMTTIEYRESVRDKWLANKSGQKYRHRFDMGVYNNVVQVLGPNMLKWLCPFAMGHLKDGTQFTIPNE